MKERLNGTDTDLTNFFFRYGANIYAFSYEKEGVKKHTLIDAGDLRYQDQILAILGENDIDPAAIERIIITHRHPDHCALAPLLAGKSGAKILVHDNFRSFVEGEVNPMERRWLGDFTPSQLGECDIEYLPQSGSNKVVNISGVDFPVLVEQIGVGEASNLTILACPQSTPTHSPDQIVVLYSPAGYSHIFQEKRNEYRPTDNIIFSGDLWLMRGPLFDRRMRSMSRYFRFGLHHMKDLLSNHSKFHRDPREQDAKAKVALKKGFSLIMVKPGHGNDFIGSRIIPDSLLADRDLLMEFGYPADESISMLKSEELAPKVAARMEQAYDGFARELPLWQELGCTSGEISELLVRIYREQSGGGPLVKNDRKERRKRLKRTLNRLKGDEAVSDELRQLAESTLQKLKSTP